MSVGLRIICFVGILFWHFLFIPASAQEVIITINAAQGKQKISPYIYGRNNTFDKPAQLYRDAGLHFVRMCGGNNATKYNWKKKISSHPDWYNNVYSNNWDNISEQIAKNHPDMQVMWAFQLLGRVASSTDHNFNDWGYNYSRWWSGVHQNLAGGGVPNEEYPNNDALVEGNVESYTQEWPADSTIGIIDHWFGPEGIGLNKNQFLYWNMDNEADIWDGTHDDVMSDGLISASEFMDRYIEVAKKAREKFPEIKICGPVTTSEWQWFKWGNEKIQIDGKYYCWLEYFIKRLADETDSTGIRLLDVFDLHNYPYAPSSSDALQVHRMYYDKDYVYPGANGIKTINGGWDNSIDKEYIFQRINDWLAEYFGEDHGITLGISEWGPSNSDPNVCSVVYASILGTFANNGVEYLTPWNWEEGMWETLHLFSRYAKNFSVSSSSTLENTVSAYTSVNETTDSMTVILVNRDENSQREVTVNINQFTMNDGMYKTLQLSSLPLNETFISHSENALEENSVILNSNSFTITLPPLSTTAVLLPSTGMVGVENNHWTLNEFKTWPNPVSDQLNIELHSDIRGPLEINIFDNMGRKLTTYHFNYDGVSPISINTTALKEGCYFIKLRSEIYAPAKSLFIKK